MANFDIADQRTDGNEGGYANNMNDHGQETVCGIARAYWPKWKGWFIIDELKKRPDWPQDIHNPKNWHKVDAMLQGNERFDQLVKDFYKANFWDTICGDQINDQRVANNIYDWEVNSGEGAPAKASQRIVGVTVDGDIGPKTVAAINAYDPEKFIEQFKAAREAFYRRIVANDPSQEQFLDEWLERNQNA